MKVHRTEETLGWHGWEDQIEDDFGFQKGEI